MHLKREHRQWQIVQTVHCRPSAPGVEKLHKTSALVHGLPLKRTTKNRKNMQKVVSFQMLSDALCPGRPSGSVLSENKRALHSRAPLRLALPKTATGEALQR